MPDANTPSREPPANAILSGFVSLCVGHADHPRRPTNTTIADCRPIPQTRPVAARHRGGCAHGPSRFPRPRAHLRVAAAGRADRDGARVSGHPAAPGGDASRGIHACRRRLGAGGLHDGRARGGADRRLARRDHRCVAMFARSRGLAPNAGVAGAGGPSPPPAHFLTALSRPAFRSRRGSAPSRSDSAPAPAGRRAPRR